MSSSDIQKVTNVGVQLMGEHVADPQEELESVAKGEGCLVYLLQSAAITALKMVWW